MAEFETITIPELTTLVADINSLIEASNPTGKSGKLTLSALSTIIAPYLVGINSSGLVFPSPSTPTVLPNPATPGVYATIVGSGTYSQTTGGNITVTGLINILVRNAGVWSTVQQLNFNLSGYLAKIHVGKNWLDTRNLITGEAYWNDGTATIRTDSFVANFKRTPKLAIDGGVVYSFSGYMETATMAYIHFFDKDGNFITFFNPSGAVSSYFNVQFAAPANAAFYGVNVRTLGDTDLKSLQIEKGTTATLPEPFIDQFTQYIVPLNGDTILHKFNFGLNKNLFNPALAVTGKDLLSTGAIIDGGRTVIEIHGIKSSTLYSLNFIDQNEYVRLNYYSDRGNFLGTLEMNGRANFTTPPATEFIRLSYGAFVPNKVMLQEGAFTGYVPYSNLTYVEPQDLKTLSDFKTSQTNLMYKSYLEYDSFIAADGVVYGGLTPPNQYGMRVFLNMKPNQKYNFDLTELQNDTLSGLSFVNIGFINSSGGTISTISLNTIGTDGPHSGFPIEFTSPAGTASIYINEMADGVHRSDYMVLTEGGEIVKSKAPYSNLIGSRALWVGNSITEFNLHQPYISKRLGFNWYNDAVPGCCITPGYENAVGDGTRRASDVERIQASSAYIPDIIILNGGLNDKEQGVPLGVITDVINPTFSNGAVVPSSVVGATFYGSAKYLIKRAIELNPNKKIFVANWHYYESTPGDYDGKRSYALAFLECARLYSIDTLNLFDTSGINAINCAQYTTDLVHLNDKGAQLYARKFVPFLNK